MKFVDLFAGLGGFHSALKSLECECVFASEIDGELRQLYRKNFGMLPVGDIRSVSEADIPEHDILCAGFHCQPFSKAGNQKGFECPQWGDLFDNAAEILRHHSLTKVHNSQPWWNNMKFGCCSTGLERLSATFKRDIAALMIACTDPDWVQE